MKSIKIIFKLFGLALMLSCSKTTPQQYIAKTAVNANLMESFYRPQFFSEIVELKKQNRLTVFRGKEHKPATAQEYLKDRLPDLKRNIDEIKSLNKTAETSDLIEASLSYFEEADKIFKNDYPKIAKMIDENRPDSETMPKIKEIFEKNDAEMFAKQQKLATVAENYAKKNKVDFRIINLNPRNKSN